MPTDQDRTCASLARAALFPKRMHRDVADDSHFPALLQLDLLRDQFFNNWPNASVSSVFPRHVVVVRNLADGGIQWNGEPDLEGEVKFQLIPDHLSVTCGTCDPALQGKAFRRPASSGSKEEEIVLCSDRILQKDSNDKKYKGVAKELPPKSLQAVEEALAHALFRIRHDNKSNATDLVANAKLEVQAAKAAECYFSRHTYEDRLLIKKGSRLQTGYSWFPAFVKNWSMNKCLMAVAKEHLVAQSVAQQDAEAAVEAALKHQ